MKDYNIAVDNLKNRLLQLNSVSVLSQLHKAQLMGGTIGEKISTISSMLKSYEISNPTFFESLGQPASDMYELCRYAIGSDPAANFDLLDELSQ